MRSPADHHLSSREPGSLWSAPEAGGPPRAQRLTVSRPTLAGACPLHRPALTSGTRKPREHEARPAGARGSEKQQEVMCLAKCLRTLED